MSVKLSEDYHVHCNYNDHSASDLTIPNIIRKATSIDLKRLAITEHVRRSSDWTERYINELNSVDTSLELLHGFEAKILSDGSIDCPPQYMDRYYIIASFHTIYRDKRIWLNALHSAIKNPGVKVIGHLAPENDFIISLEEVLEIGDLLKSNNKILEINAKYRRPSKNWLEIFKSQGVKFHLGSDAHSLHAIGDFSAVADLVEIANNI